MASSLNPQKTEYHGQHEYSTFSSSLIPRPPIEENMDATTKKNVQNRYLCCLCHLSSSLILHPVGPFRCVWDLFVMILLIYTSIEIPFTISFGTQLIIQYIGLFVDGFLLIDIFLNFHTAYFDKYDNLRLVTNKKYICKRYFSSWFFIDFFTCIPFEFILPDNNNSAIGYVKVLRIFRLFRIIKILRFLKMLRILDAFMKQFIVRELITAMKIFKIVFGMLMFAHFASCLWWYVGEKTNPSWIDAQGLRDSNLSSFQLYSYAWYWAVVTLFTTGYGDITATNTAEQWVSSICILIGTCFFAYFVGTLTVLLTEGDKIRSYELEKLEEAQSFCERKKLPKELTRAILTHIRYHCTYNYIFDENEILSILPSYLQHDIHTWVSKQSLMDLGIFQNEYIHLPDFIIGLIAVKTKSISCNQNYKLFDIGDMSKEFYIQRTGKSTLYNKDNKPLYELSRGDVCGEYSAFLFKRRKYVCRCDTWSEFYSISIDDIREILELYFPKSATNKLKKIKKYLKMCFDSNLKHHANLRNYKYSSFLTANQEEEDENMTMDIASYPSAKSVHTLRAPKHSDDALKDSVHLFNNSPSIVNRSGLSSPKAYFFQNNHEKELAVHMEMSNKSAQSGKEDKVMPVPIPKAVTIDKSTRTRTMSKTADDEIRKLPTSSFVKTFAIRSNSELRDMVIVEHTKKHNNAHPENDGKRQRSLSKTKTKIKYKNDSPTKHQNGVITNKENVKTIEMGGINSPKSPIIMVNDEMVMNDPSFAANTINNHAIVGSVSIRSQFSTLDHEDRDSECSYSSLDTHSSYDASASHNIQVSKQVKKKRQMMRKKGKNGKLMIGTKGHRKGMHSKQTRMKMSNVRTPKAHKKNVKNDELVISADQNNGYYSSSSLESPKSELLLDALTAIYQPEKEEEYNEPVHIVTSNDDEILPEIPTSIVKITPLTIPVNNLELSPKSVESA